MMANTKDIVNTIAYNEQFIVRQADILKHHDDAATSNTEHKTCFNYLEDRQYFCVWYLTIWKIYVKIAKKKYIKKSRDMLGIDLECPTFFL